MTSLLEQIKKKTGRYLPFEQDGQTYNLYDLPDGFVIKVDLDLNHKGLEKLPDLTKVIIKGGLNLYGNELTSLKGLPREIGGDFICFGNKLTSLKGAPRKVGKDFDCGNNQLTTLEGAPQDVGRNFRCFANKLVNLQGAPRKINGDFDCIGSELTSLEGGPEEVYGIFYCVSNKLTSLKGAPRKVDGNFCCYKNELTSLEGALKEVCGSFLCYDNQLKSLFGISKVGADWKIFCDDDLGEKYGFAMSKDAGINYEDLLESQTYQNEVALHRIACKRHGQNRAEEDAKRQAKHKAGFAAFKKKINEERE